MIAIKDAKVKEPKKDKYWMVLPLMNYIITCSMDHELEHSAGFNGIK